MTVEDLPAFNAILNAISAFFLLLGYRRIRNRDTDAERRIGMHKRWMLAALGSSALFLTAYLIYHHQVGSVPYLHRDWTRPVYFAVLIPHIILAAVMGPFILLLVWHAFREDVLKHRRIARWIWPVWMFVSLSGIAVYLMLYHL